MSNSAERFLTQKRKVTDIMRSKIFDIIAIFTVLVMSLISLSALELRDISFESFVDILIESFPFYLAATMLSRNYYNKGACIGKEQDSFINAVKYYSEQVIKLDGKALSVLPSFCTDYNIRTLKNTQEAILHSVAVTYERFHVHDEKAGAPLKIVPYKTIRKLYGKDVAVAILRCKKAKIKGLNPNLLLSNLNNADGTDIGDSERVLAKKRTFTYALSYMVSILLMSLIGVKSILEWGWVGLFLTLFKLAFVVSCSYTRYYEGYEDITVNVVDHLFRKSDILKEFDYWRKPVKEKDNVKQNTTNLVE